MRFTAEHEFAASADAVAQVLGDADLYRTLELPDLGTPEVVADEVVTDEAAGVEGAGRRLRLRYEYLGHLDPVARSLLGGSRPTWIQEVVVSPVGGSLTFAAEANPSMLHGGATFTLREVEDGRTVRVLEGDVVVSLPIVGAMAERRIVPGVLSRLDAEAAAVRARLAPG